LLIAKAECWISHNRKSESNEFDNLRKAIILSEIRVIPKGYRNGLNESMPLLIHLSLLSTMGQVEETLTY
jgi:hypothetical protein